MRFIKNGSIANKIILLAAGSAYIWGLAASVARSLGFNISYGWLLQIVILSMLALGIIFYNRVTVIVFSLLTLLTSMLILISEKNNPWFVSARNSLTEFFSGLLRYITGFEAVKPEYEKVICIALIIALSIITYAFYELKHVFFVLLIIMLLILGCCVYSNNNIAFFQMSVCITGLFVLFAHYTSREKNLALVLAAALVSVLCFVAASLIPIHSSDKTIALQNIISKPFDIISDAMYPIFSKKYYAFRNTGYVDKNDKLGGNIRLSGRKVMEIVSEEPLYLVGAYNDTYTGYSWINSNVSSNIADTPYLNTGIYGENIPLEKDLPSVELLEMAFSNLVISLRNGEFELIGQMLENPELIKNSVYRNRATYTFGGVMTIEMQLSAYKRRVVDIYMRDARTFSLFVPGMAAGVLTSGEGFDLTEKDGILTSSQLIEVDEPYSVIYRITPSGWVSYWSSILFNSKQGLYQELKEAFEAVHEKYNFDKKQLSVNIDESRDNEPGQLHMINIYPKGSEYFDSEKAIAYEDLLIDTLIPRAEEIKQRYTALPEHLPERIRTLSENLVKDIQSDYFKASEIANFLRKFPYTLSPGDTPDDRDFVDYFLFDIQKGYCTYFASAFVVMCRTIGLPARYVEGYVTPNERNENGLYEITNRQAHAWCEVYFEGYGWVRFDPTPALGDAEVIQELIVLKENYQTASEDIHIDFEGITDVKNSNEALPLSVNESDKVFETAEHGNLSDSVVTYTNEGWVGSNNMLIKNFLLAVLIFIFLAIVFVFFRVLAYEKKEKSLRRLSGNKAVEAYYKKLVKLFMQLGIPVFSEDTYFILAERAEYFLPPNKMLLEIQDLAEIFSKLSYSSNPISEKDITTIRNMVTLTEAYIREQIGVLQYFNVKYIKKRF